MYKIEEFFEVKKETIGRLPYFIANISTSLLLTIFVKIYNQHHHTFKWQLLGLLILIPYLYVYVTTTLKRLKDVGMRKAWLIVGFIPGIKQVLFIYLCLKEGKNNSEK